MKKIYLGILALITSIGAFAQPTLTGAQLNPVIGEQITFSQGDYISDLPNGSNQTWDFSSITATAGTGSFTMIPSNSAHPGTNIAYDYGSGDVVFCQNDATQQAFKYQEVSGVVITFSDMQKTMQFPLNSSTNMTDPFAATFTSGVAFSRQGSSTLTYEGYGTVITSVGTYTDCIKSKLVQIYTDTYAGGTIDYEIIVYNWHKAGIHYPVFIVGSYAVDGDPPFQYTQFYEGSSLEIKEKSIVESSLYPNPTNDEITLVVENNGNIEALNVYDMKGQLIGTQTVQQTNGQAKLDVQGLESGFYIIEAQLSSGSIARKKFQKL